MSAIEKFRDRGYELVAEKNLIKFKNQEGGTFFFYLNEQRIGTSILYTSEYKEFTKIIKKFQKELGWKEIKEIPFW